MGIFLKNAYLIPILKYNFKKVKVAVKMKSHRNMINKILPKDTILDKNN